MQQQPEFNDMLIGTPILVPPHLKPFERAARIYMAKVGGDPEAFIPQPHPTLANTMVRMPVWCVAAMELIDFSYKFQSLHEAMRASGVVVVES